MSLLYIDDYVLQPAPFISLNKNINFTTDGRPIGASYAMVWDGTLLPNRGSPSTTGFTTAQPVNESWDNADHKFDALLKKQQHMRDLLSTTGYKFRWSSNSGAIGGERWECYPKLTSINFEPNPWVIRTDYQATFEVPELYYTDGDNPINENHAISGATGLNLASASDSWQLRERPNTDHIYEISRTVTAQGRAFYLDGELKEDKQPWENAKTWVDYQITNFSDFSDNHFGLPITATTPDYSKYNFVEENSIDKYGGNYTVSQRFIYAPTGVIETRTVNKTFTANRVDDLAGSGVETISVNGRFEGLTVDENDVSGKLAAASSYYHSIFRLGVASLVGANGEPLAENVTYDETNGTVSYNLSFTNNDDNTFIRHTYETAVDDSQGTWSLTINGRVEGMESGGIYTSTTNTLSTPSGENTAWDWAESGWINNIRPNVKQIAMSDSNIYPGGLGSNFLDNPTRVNITKNKAQGFLTYSYTYDRQWSDGIDDLWNETFTIVIDDALGFSADKGGNSINVSINGTIVGTPADRGDDDKYKCAQSGYHSVTDGATPPIYDRCNNVFKISCENFSGGTQTLQTTPVVRQLTHNQMAGTIGYAYTYNNRMTPEYGDDNIAIADINVSQEHPTDMFAVQNIPGISTGPILQNVGALTENRRTINIALTMNPSGDDEYWTYGGVGLPRKYANEYFSGIVSDIGGGLRGTDFFLAGHSDDWNYQLGVYSAAYVVTY